MRIPDAFLRSFNAKIEVGMEVEKQVIHQDSDKKRDESSSFVFLRQTLLMDVGAVTALFCSNIQNMYKLRFVQQIKSIPFHFYFILK